jgi:hypothetical protein
MAYKLFHIPESTFVEFLFDGIRSKTNWKKWLKNNKICYYPKAKAYGWRSNSCAKKVTSYPGKDIILLNSKEFDIIEVKDAK